MLKRLVILGLLAVVGSSPIPGQAPNHGSQAGEKPKQPTSDGKSPAKPTITLIEKNCDSDQFKNDPDCKKTENNENAVSVSKLPTANVSIQKNAERDIFDWIAYLGGLVLVGVGIWGVRVAVKTLKAIEKQANLMVVHADHLKSLAGAAADNAEAAKTVSETSNAQMLVMQTQAKHMEHQTKILEDSVAVAKESAEAAKTSADAASAQIELMKSKERAQIRVEFAGFDFGFDENLGGFPVRFTVTLDGTTRAYILSEAIIAYTSGLPPEKRHIRKQIGLPKNLTPEMSPIELYTLIQTDTGWPQDETDGSRIGSVSENRLFLFVNGYICYRDIFGDRWELKFSQTWKNWSSYGDKSAIGGMWVGANEYGGYDHRRIDHLSPKPN